MLQLCAWVCVWHARERTEKERRLTIGGLHFWKYLIGWHCSHQAAAAKWWLNIYFS